MMYNQVVDEIHLKAIAASIVAANDRADLLAPSYQIMDLFFGPSVRNQYDAIDSPEKLAGFVERLHDEGLDISPEKISDGISDAQIASLKTHNLPDFQGAEELYFLGAGRDYHGVILNNPAAFKDVINNNIAVFDRFLQTNRTALAEKGWYYHNNLPNPKGMNPPYFSDNKTHFVDIDNGHAIYAAALDAMGPDVRDKTKERLAELVSKPGDTDEPHTLYLAMLDYYPAGFSDGTALTEDGSPLTGKALLDAQNNYLREALQLYQAAEKAQDGTGNQVVMDFIAETYPDYANPDGPTSYNKGMHGILTAVQMLDSFEKEATELGMDGNIQLMILPNDVDRAGAEFFQTYDPGNDPRLPADAVIAGWSISLASIYKDDSRFVERQIAAGYPVFAAAGNLIRHREETAFISPQHAIGVGGNSCHGDFKAELVTSEHTDVSFDNPYDKDGDCQTVSMGTSFSTPYAAGVGLPHMLKDMEGDRELNGTTIPEGFTPQLTYPKLEVADVNSDEPKSLAAPHTSPGATSRSSAR